MTSPYDWPRGPWQRDPHRQPQVSGSELRVGNVERDEVSKALCRHFSDGRLDEAEFNERLEKCTAAKTRSDLDPLLADLPPLPGESPIQSGSPHPPYPLTPPQARPWRIHPVLFVIGCIFAVSVLAHATAWAWHGSWVVIGVIVAVALLIRHDHRHRRP